MSNTSSEVSRGPCECGSSQGCVLFDDGHTHCFSCGKTTQAASGSSVPSAGRNKKKRPLLGSLSFRPIPSRKLTEDSCKRWDYAVSEDGRQVAGYRPRDGGPVVAQKWRNRDKQFGWLGDRSNIGLYGEWLWKSGGKIVVVVEGELDAISLSQAQGHRWPVVSVPDGAQSAVAAVKRSIDFLASFERVVLMLDNDEPGRKAAMEVATILPPGKAHIASLPLKDASDMLVEGRVKELLDAIWTAKPFRPDGIVAADELWDRVCSYRERTKTGMPYPWEGLNRLTRGQRPGELTMWTGGTGSGKTETVRQVAYDLLFRKGRKVGIIALEEPAEKTALVLAGMTAGCRLTLDSDRPLEEIQRIYRDAFKDDRLVLYDHFGSMDSENLFSRIRYMVTACGCQDIVLDHISIAVSGLDSGDERKDIDILMTRCRSLVEELRINMHTICHLRRLPGVAHEEGSPVSLTHLRGSQGLIHVPDNIFSLERDQQSPDKQHYTRLRVLKCRWTGDLGIAGWLKYDKQTGFQEECGDPFSEMGTDETEEGGQEDF